MEIKSDNACPINSDVYDNNIRKTLPHYDDFRNQILDIVEFRNLPIENWLDLGCGTGSLEQLILQKFPDVRFTMADPSQNMLDIAKEKLGEKHEYICKPSQELEDDGRRYDVISAVQCHHYLQKDERENVTKFIYDSLKPGGIYFCFENVLQADQGIADFEYRRWLEYRFKKGIDRAQLPELLERLNTKFFPITIPEHVKILENAGFSKVCVFWLSYMQMGIYGVK